MGVPSPDFVFRSGKYLGKTYKWVCDNNPNYIEWIKENQPKMLVEKTSNPTKTKESKQVFKKLTPNMNFDNEGPTSNS